MHVPARAVFVDRVQDNDHVPPPRAAFAREQNEASSDGVNRIAQVGVLPANAVHIVAEMIILREWLSVISERTVFSAKRIIETCGKRERCEVE